MLGMEFDDIKLSNVSGRMCNKFPQFDTGSWEQRKLSSECGLCAKVKTMKLEIGRKWMEFDSEVRGMVE
jgi:hypothetical protein